MNRTNAASNGGTDRQTLRDWFHRIKEHGPAGLKDGQVRYEPLGLNVAQQAELASLIAMGLNADLRGGRRLFDLGCRGRSGSGDLSRDGRAARRRAL